MRALVLADVGSVEVADRPRPDLLHDEDAIVEMELAGLCGSDLHPYLGREPAAAGVIQGHEGVGRVVAVGSEVDPRWRGERAIIPFTTSCGACAACRRSLTSRCRHGELFGWGDPSGVQRLEGLQTEAVRVPLAASTLVPMPDSLPPAVGVLLSDNFPTAAHAVQRAELAAGDRLVVVGLGSVGLCAVTYAVQIGLDVVGIDPVPQRRRAASALGVPALSPEDVGELEVDGSVEASGSAGGQEAAVRTVREGGTVSVVAVQTRASKGIDPILAYERNLTIRFGRAPVRALLDALAPAVADGSLTVNHDVIVTHPDLPLDAGPETYRRFAAREDAIVKATFRPGRIR